MVGTPSGTRVRADPMPLPYCRQMMRGAGWSYSTVSKSLTWVMPGADQAVSAASVRPK
jgi:hypothetical protein